MGQEAGLASTCQRHHTVCAPATQRGAQQKQGCCCCCRPHGAGRCPNLLLERCCFSSRQDSVIKERLAASDRWSDSDDLMVHCCVCDFVIVLQWHRSLCKAYALSQRFHWLDPAERGKAPSLAAVSPLADFRTSPGCKHAQVEACNKAVTEDAITFQMGR